MGHSQRGPGADRVALYFQFRRWQTFSVVEFIPASAVKYTHLEYKMKRVSVVAAVLLLSALVLAQPAEKATAAKAPSDPLQSLSGLLAAGGGSRSNGIGSLANAFGESFWNDPKMVAELHLSEAQVKQLREASLNMQLALIDGGADVLKAFVHISAILRVEQLDDAAYQKQLDALSAGFGKVIHDIGDMAIAPRHILTHEQYLKLKTIERKKREERLASFTKPAKKPVKAADADSAEKKESSK